MEKQKIWMKKSQANFEVAYLGSATRQMGSQADLMLTVEGAQDGLAKEVDLGTVNGL